MSVPMLTVYVLIWPLIVLGVLVVLVRAFVSEWKRARSEGRDII